MGKTHRKSPLDKQYGCLEGFVERNKYWGTDIHWQKFRLNRKIEHWLLRNRDGKARHFEWRDTHCTRNILKDFSKKDIRTQTRKLISKGMSGEVDWDDVTFPTNKDGKKYVFSAL